jgi:hypothetical protein
MNETEIHTSPHPAKAGNHAIATERVWAGKTDIKKMSSEGTKMKKLFLIIAFSFSAIAFDGSTFRADSNVVIDSLVFSDFCVKYYYHINENVIWDDTYTGKYVFKIPTFYMVERCERESMDGFTWKKYKMSIKYDYQEAK